MIKVLSEIDSRELVKKLNALKDCEIISVYGFSGHHWAFVKEIEIKTKENKEVLNGNKKRR